MQIGDMNEWEILWEAAQRLSSGNRDLAKREVWNRYMASRDWQLKRRKALERAGGRCEKHGGATDFLQVHHLTYIRRFREALDDLQVICRACHDFVSGVSDIEPETEAA